jgi:hypothetical protein
VPDLNALPATAAGLTEATGFPVTRLASAEALLKVGVMPGDTIAGHRLFVFQGIPSMHLGTDGFGALRVPDDAFAHTDPAAVVHLEARLADGRPLPEWLSFEGVRGIFVGVPPEGLNGSLEIEVIARDTEGREAHTRFILLVDDLRTGGMRAGDPAGLPLGLDVDKTEAEKARLEARQAQGRQAAQPRLGADGKLQKGPAASFSEQMRAAKATRDPLLDKIARADTDKPRSKQ